MTEANLGAKLTKWTWRKLDKLRPAGGQNTSRDVSEGPFDDGGSPFADEEQSEGGGGSQTSNNSADPEEHRSIRRRTRSPAPEDESSYTEGAVFRLAPDICVMVFELVLEPFRLTALDYNTKVEMLRRVCKYWKRIIDYRRGFWTRITTRCSLSFIKEAIRKSDWELSPKLLFDIEALYRLSDSQTFVRDFGKLIGLVHQFRHQWRSLDVRVPSSGTQRLLRELDTPAPRLQSLEIVIVSDPRRDDADYGQLTLLENNGDSLKTLKHANLRVHFNPSAFTALSTLRLCDAISIQAGAISTFLSQAIDLEVFELSNVRSSSGPFPTDWRHPVMCPSLRSLTLRELQNPINILSLFLGLDTPKCEHLCLAFSEDQEPSPDDEDEVIDELKTKVAMVTQAIELLDSTSTSFVRLGKERDGMEWWSEGTNLEGETVGVRLTIRLSVEDVDPENEDVAWFCGLVGDVLQRADQGHLVKIDIFDGLSSTPPILPPDIFKDLHVSELTVNVADGYLGQLATFLTTPDGGRRFPALGCLHLITISFEEEKKHWLYPKSLAGLLRTLADAEYARSEPELKVVLHGEFEGSKDWWKGFDEMAYTSSIREKVFLSGLGDAQ
ncbi:hypothetical protein FRB90_011688 [Tulasnella sp. 427]|nr:hypothetical protein FRB90_011688 [Tulasnella sp. 427]